MTRSPWWTWWISGLGVGWCARSVWAWLRSDGLPGGLPKMTVVPTHTMKVPQRDGNPLGRGQSLTRGTDMVERTAPEDVNYPEWCGRLSAHLEALLNALDGQGPYWLDIAREVARRDLDRFDKLTHMAAGEPDGR